MKTEVVFKPNYGDNEDNSSDDSEIEIIPYTKPPPVVIDLLEESENEEGEGDEESGHKKKKKKSKKNKDRKKEKEQSKRSGDGRRSENASTSCSAIENESFVSLADSDQNDSVVSEGHHLGTPRSNEFSVSSSQNVEPVVVTATRVEVNPAQPNPGSENVSGRKRNSATSSISNENEIGCRSSSPEKSRKKKKDSRKSNSDTASSLNGIIDMAGGSATSQPQSAENPSQTQTPNQTEKRSGENARKRGEGAGRGRGKSTRNTEPRRSLITQKTNEEIINFLTTIGIEMESTAFDPPTPTPRKRQSKKKAPNSEVDTESANESNDGAAASTNSSGTGLPAFVSVTQENTSPTKKGKGGRRKRQAVDGDLSDFNVNFTNADLNAVNTSFQSNLIIPGAASSRSLMDQCIDFVARGLDVQASATSETSSSNVTIHNESSDNVDEFGDNEARVATETYKAARPAESPKTAKAKDKNTAETESVRPPIAVTSKRVENNDSTSSKTSEVVAEESSPAKQGREKENRPPRKSTETEATAPSGIEYHFSENTTESTVVSSTRSAATTAVVPFRPAELPDLNLGVFPSTWTLSMRDFYDTERDANFELDDIWTTQSDSPAMWVSHADIMRPPKSKRSYVRCERCKQLGHFKRECNEPWKPPCCHMCGNTGHSSGFTSRNNPLCPDARCLNCSHKLDQYSQKCGYCLIRRKPTRCPICNVIGHDKEVCPDQWRRYHSITSLDQLEISSLVDQGNKVYKRSSTLYCANCSRKGHSYYDCNGSRFNPYHRNKPFVVHNLPAPSSSSDRSPPAAAGSSSSSSANNTSTEETIFDPKTGRAVVLNKDDSVVTEIAVETIQVKITNDLAQPSAPPAIIKCTQEESCTNMIKENERCYQTIMQDHAHTKLRIAKNEGRLKQVEDKHGVQISIILSGSASGCNKVHIYGANSNEAETDLYRFLWLKTKTTESSQTEKEKDNSTIKVAPPVQSPDCIILDDDDDDICVIDEIPASNKKPNGAAAADTQQNQNTPTSSSKNAKTMEGQFQQETPARNRTNENKRRFDKQDNSNAEPSRKSDSRGTGSSSNGGGGEGNQPRLNGNGYESPYTGILTPPEKRSRWDSPQDQMPMGPGQMINNFNQNPFNQFNTFQQLPPNPNPFFENGFDMPMQQGFNSNIPFINAGNGSNNNAPWNNNSPWDFPPNQMDMFRSTPPPPMPMQNNFMMNDPFSNNHFPGPGGPPPSLFDVNVPPPCPPPFNDFPMRRNIQNDLFVKPNCDASRDWTNIRDYSDNQQRRPHDFHDRPCSRKPSSSTTSKNVETPSTNTDSTTSVSTAISPGGVGINDAGVAGREPSTSSSPSPSTSTSNCKLRLTTNKSQLAKTGTEQADDDDVEIITIEEDDTAEDNRRKSKGTSSRNRAPINSAHEKVTLLQSEWKLVTEELMKADNTMNMICEHFGVELMASKEAPDFFIYISKGSAKERRMAKDNVIFWLENQCANTPYHFLPTGYEDMREENRKLEKEENKKAKQQQQRNTRLQKRNQRKKSR